MSGWVAEVRWRGRAALLQGQLHLKQQASAGEEKHSRRRTRRWVPWRGDSLSLYWNGNIYCVYIYYSSLSWFMDFAQAAGASKLLHCYSVTVRLFLTLAKWTRTTSVSPLSGSSGYFLMSNVSSKSCKCSLGERPQFLSRVVSLWIQRRLHDGCLDQPDEAYNQPLLIYGRT